MMTPCCGKGDPIRRPAPCADGRLPLATPDAILAAQRLGVDLCAHQGEGSAPGGRIVKSDVERWAG